MQSSCSSGHNLQLSELHLLQQCEWSSENPINLTLICVCGDEHRNRVKLIAVAPLPT